MWCANYRSRPILLFPLLWLAACGTLEMGSAPPASATLEPTRAATAIMAPTPVTAIEGNAVAYVQHGDLYIRDLPQAHPPILVDDCQGPNCLFQYLKWSPNGQYLLYYRENNGTREIRLADRQGMVQTVASDTASLRPAAWSPDGRQIAFLRQTDRWIESEPLGNIVEVWSVAVAASGAISDAKIVGEIHGGAGCGGGGRSQSDELYEREGGTAYGFRMSKTEWTAQNILLYTLDCGNAGIGRFDMSTGTELEPYAVLLRGLVLNQAGDRWIAVTWDASSTEPGDHKLVTGDPTSTDTEIIPTSAPVELVYVGPVSGHIYYTSRHRTGGANLSDDYFFNFYESALWMIHADGSGEKLLWQAADHSFAGVTEALDGSILFVRVENDVALYEAVQDETVAPERWVDYLPQRHIVRILAPGGEPEPWLENAGNLAISPK